MKKYKLWEALEMIGKNKSLVFKNNYDEEMKYKNGGVRTFKNNKNLNFYGFDIKSIWEIQKQPITFEEVLNSNERCRVEHELIDLKSNSICCESTIMIECWERLKNNEYLNLNELLAVLGYKCCDIDVKRIIKEGKWYLEG